MSKLAKRLAIGVAAVALLVGGGIYGHYFWQTGRFLESTDDAYVRADYTTVAPKISGYIDAVAVEDNQQVHAGDVLARIDDRDLKTALDQARSDVASAQAGMANIRAQQQLQRTLIDQAQAKLESDQASLDYATKDSERYGRLSASGSGSVQQAQSSLSVMREKAAAVAADQAAVAAARQQVQVLGTELQKAAAELAHDQAVQHQAELNLGYATIAAPIDGTIGQRSLRVGQYVQAGTQLMAVVPLDEVYVVANFKETQLTEVRPGAPVELTVDTFPGRVLTGRVDSLAPASGQTFALLPADNATGNFTKIVQRIPVKIVLDDAGRLAGLLRPGMSVESTIDTRGQAAASAKLARN